MKAPLGAYVRIFYDSDVLVAPGDYLVTTTGRTYEVVSVRVQQRGMNAGRQHLGCLVVESRPHDSRGRTHGICWYRREKRSVRILT